MRHDPVPSPLTIALDAVNRLTDADKLAVLADMLTGGIDMGEALADALIPLDHCLDANMNSLRAAVGGE
ncbi:MAG: hypothetical protein AB7E60_02890 [Sphingobium sp.]